MIGAHYSGGVDTATAVGETADTELGSAAARTTSPTSCCHQL